MLELFLHYNEAPLHIRDISTAQDIPPCFLEQILLSLKRNGYLRSKKGPHGPLAPLDCVSVTAHEFCPRENFCGLKWLWKEVRDSIAKILENTSFEDLAQRTKKARGKKG
jgi:Rrf2 family cysteine metabolism transcriptional repressor